MAILHPALSSMELVQQYTVIATTEADSGVNTVVAAPGANVRIVVKELVVQNASSTTTTVLVESGETTCWRVTLGEREAFVLSFPAGEEWRLAANAALVVDLSGANSHNVSGRYFTEAA
jgi:hypothetical protein